MFLDHTGDDGYTPIERVIFRDEIRQLAYRYAYALDNRDIDELVRLFVPDVQVGRDEVGHEALEESFRASLSAVGVTFLMVANHTVTFSDPTHAAGRVYCRAHVAEQGRFVEQAIRYDDDYRRHEGQWLFVRRRHQLFYGVPTAEQPMHQDPAGWPASSVGTGTLPEAEPSWGRFWASAGTQPPA